MSLSIPELCEELKPYVGRSERTDLGIIRKEAFQRFAVAADNLNPVFFEPEAARAAGYPDAIAPPLFLSSVRNWQAGPPQGSLRPDGTTSHEFAFLPLEGMRIMGGGQDLEFHAPVTDGTRVSMELRLDGVELKQGRSGDLILIKVTQIYRDAADRPLVTCRETFIAR
jgi:acyl dehydratase